MSRINVGVLRGGPSAEYEVSLNTGGNVLRHLPEDKYHGHDIFIDKKGDWHIHGTPVTPRDALSRIDVAFNALHGEYGEDGRIQRILEQHGTPYTGSDSLGSAVGMNKAMAKDIFIKHGIKTPFHKVFSRDQEHFDDFDKFLFDLFRSFPLPLVVKPLSRGSSVGVSIVRSFNDLEPAIIKAFELDDSIIVEEFIPGVEATCGVIEGYRNHDLYVLPPIEIRPHNGFFDYEAKYAGKSQEIVPGNFDPHHKMTIEEVARLVHTSLGLRHYSRTDMIVHPRRGVYVLETNTLPGLTDESLLPKALAAVGSSVGHFVDHVVELALAKKKEREYF